MQTIDSETLRKSFREAIEELEAQAPVEVEEELDDPEDYPEVVKAKDKKKKIDDDYDDVVIDDEDDDDEDDEDMDKAVLMEDAEVSRDREVMSFGRGMKTIIYMRKSIDDLQAQVDALTKASSGSLKLLQAIGDLVIDNAEVSGNISKSVEAIGDQPVRTATVLKKSVEDGFAKPTNAREADQLLRKSIKAVQDNNLNGSLIPMLEARIRTFAGNPETDIFAPTGQLAAQWDELKTHVQG